LGQTSAEQGLGLSEAPVTRGVTSAQLVEGLGECPLSFHRLAAESHYLLAAGIAENLPLGHRAIAYPKLALARLWIDLGQPMKAQGTLTEALDELRRSHAAGHWRLAQAESLLGRSLTEQRRFEAAEQHLAVARELHVSNPETAPDRQREVLEWLLDLYRLWQRPDQAQEVEQRLAELTMTSGAE
ncbi:MAG: hypothetical protein AAF560_27380, partial [Acidobacteriota bacterium]